MLGVKSGHFLYPFFGGGEQHRQISERHHHSAWSGHDQAPDRPETGQYQHQKHTNTA